MRGRRAAPVRPRSLAGPGPGAGGPARSGRLLLSADGSQWLAARKRPQRLVDLRGTGRSFVIEDSEGTVIGSVDGFRAWRETHVGAVYLHRGRSYVIEEMDPAAGRVRARQAKVDWFTRVRGHKSTDILEELERRPLGRGVVCRGRLRIIDTITGYEKRSTRDNRLLTIVPLEAPPQIFETEGLWYVIPESCRQRLEEDFVHFMGSIHACEHTAIGMLPLLVMADRNDFGGISIPLHPQTGLACVFIYDGLPGGAGLTRQAFGHARELLEGCAALIEACPCEDGCPSCVHSPKCGSGNRPISKAGALRLIRDLLAPGADAEGEALCADLRISPPPELLPPQPVDEPAAPVPPPVPDMAAIMAAWAGQAPATAPAGAAGRAGCPDKRRWSRGSRDGGFGRRSFAGGAYRGPRRRGLCGRYEPADQRIRRSREAFRQTGGPSAPVIPGGRTEDRRGHGGNSHPVDYAKAGAHGSRRSCR